MNIVVIGSGYVGTTAAAIFALSGHKVTAIDIDATKVALINSGKAPFFEEGLDNIITKAINDGTLVASKNYAESIPAADVVFSCVGTPDNPDGSSNLEYIFGSAKEAATHLKAGAVYVQKSTVPVGTGRKVVKLLPSTVKYVSNPEFLRESTAILDTVVFDRVVAGGDDEEANQIVLDVHRSVEANAAHIAEIAKIDVTSNRLTSKAGEYISTHLESAELIKVTANAFLSLKISFANSIAKLCDVAGADIQEVMSAVGRDERIGKAFFNAGRGYGGGCFPKDVSGLISSAREFGVDLPIMTSARDVNASMPDYIVNKVASQYGPLEGKMVTVLGLAFKAGTSDTRKSPAIIIANQLVKLGVQVKAYDPEAMKEARHSLEDGVILCESTEEALDGSEVVFLATDWKEFTQISNWSSMAPKAKVLVDCMNCLSKEKVGNLQYVAIGKTS